MEWHRVLLQYARTTIGSWRRLANTIENDYRSNYVVAADFNCATLSAGLLIVVPDDLLTRVTKLLTHAHWHNRQTRYSKLG